MASLPSGCQGPEMEYDVGLGQLDTHLRADAHAQQAAQEATGEPGAKLWSNPEHYARPEAQCPWQHALKKTTPL